MGLYTPTILGGNSYLSWFYDRGAIKDPAHTETSKGLSQAINRGPIRKFFPKYANIYVTIQGYDLSAGVWTHYVTANGVRNGLPRPGLYGPRSANFIRGDTKVHRYVWAHRLIEKSIPVSFSQSGILKASTVTIN